MRLKPWRAAGRKYVRAGARPGRRAVRAWRSGHRLKEDSVISLLVFGALMFAGLIVFGVLAAVIGLAGFVITLPFRILGWTLRLLGLLIALPFLLLACALTFGAALLPLAPLALVAWFFWWLFHDRKPRHSQPSVIS